MATRFRKYFKQYTGTRAKGDRYGKVIGGIRCEGKRSSKVCPENVPSPCGAWAIDYRELDGRWSFQESTRHRP